MNWKVCLVVILISASLAACSTTARDKQVGFTDSPAGVGSTSRDFKMPIDSTMTRKMDGEATVKQGETMMLQGKAMMQQDKAKEGQIMMQKGQTMMKKGQTMIQESTATQP